jgi:hypothetical protein
LLCVSAVAVYFTVPDTELPLVMVGCAVPLALLSFPQPLRRLGPSGAAAAMGVYAWVAVIGGRGRPGSAVAAIAALGLLIAEPVARLIPSSTESLIKRDHHRPRGRSDAWIIVAVVAALAQLALGVFCATVAGRETDTALAILITVPAFVVMGAAAPLLLPRRDSSRRAAYARVISRSRRARQQLRR